MARGELHRIEDDLRDVAVDEWAESVVDEVEAYLAKHAAFARYLESREQ
jgi:hypothetical protein